MSACRAEHWRNLNSGYCSIRLSTLANVRAALRTVSASGQSQTVSRWEWPMMPKEGAPAAFFDARTGRIMPRAVRSFGHQLSSARSAGMASTASNTSPRASATRRRRGVSCPSVAARPRSVLRSAMNAVTSSRSASNSAPSNVWQLRVTVPPGASGFRWPGYEWPE